MTFTQVFGGTTIFPSQVSYLALDLDADLTFEWPLDAATGTNVIAQIVDVTTDGAWTITMPDAQEASNGQTVLFNNLGPDDVDVVDAVGGAILTLSPGDVWQIYLTSNATEAGAWRSFQYGASTAQAQAAALAGNGVIAIGSVLAQSTDVSTINTTPYTLLTSDRANAFVWVGGIGTFDLPAAAVVGNNWFINVRNGGTGNLTIDPSASETINAASTLTLLPGDSAVLVTDGAEWWTIGLGKQSIFTFDFTSIDLGGESGDYTLSGAELNRIAYEFTGALSGNTTVIVPPTTQQYWVTNSATGFTLALKVSGSSSSINIASGDKGIYYSNGTDLVQAVTTSGIPTPIAIADGGTNATSAANARSNLGVAARGANADITSLTGLGAGTVSGPSISPTGDGNTGHWFPAADRIAGATGGQLAYMVEGTANGNVAMGYRALDALTSNNTANIALGADALGALTSGASNIAIGDAAGVSLTTGSNNVAIGDGSCSSLSGSNNTVVGAVAAFSATTASNCTVIGYQASPSSNTASNQVTLGNASVSILRCQVTTITALSDERDKTAIHTLRPGVDFINALRPVEFEWNMRDGGKRGDPDIGFIAQELLSAQEATGHHIPHLVDETNPDKLEAGYGMLIPVLVRAIQQIDERLSRMEAALG